MLEFTRALAIFILFGALLGGVVQAQTKTPPAPSAVKLTTVNGSTTITDAASGLTLYVFDGDTTPGKSACNGACATNWPPLAATAGAKPVGDFTIITRDDGSMQWAYKGQPLYHWKNDKAPGDMTGDGVAGKWHVAKLSS